MTWGGGEGVEGGRASQKRKCVYQWLIPADVWQKPTHSYSQQPDRFWQKEWGKGKIGEGD